MFGSILIAFSIYLLYSAGGGTNGIIGFNQKIWWQFTLALIPMFFGIGFIVSCQIESLSISRKDNWIIATKQEIRQHIEKGYSVLSVSSDLIGLSVVKNGKQSTY